MKLGTNLWSNNKIKKKKNKNKKKDNADKYKEIKFEKTKF